MRRTTHDVPVAIYCQEAGKPEPAEPTVTVTADGSGGLAMFAAMLPGFKHNVLVTAEVGALSADTLPGADQLTVKVRAATRLAVTHRGGRLVLIAHVLPSDADGKVFFQRQVRGRWVAAGSATIASGIARTTVRRRRQPRPGALRRRLHERRRRLDDQDRQVEPKAGGPGTCPARRPSSSRPGGVHSRTASSPPARSRLRAAPVRQPC